MKKYDNPQNCMQGQSWDIVGHNCYEKLHFQIIKNKYHKKQKSVVIDMGKHLKCG